MPNVTERELLELASVILFVLGMKKTPNCIVEFDELYDPPNEIDRKMAVTNCTGKQFVIHTARDFVLSQHLVLLQTDDGSCQPFAYVEYNSSVEHCDHYMQIFIMAKDEISRVWLDVHNQQEEPELRIWDKEEYKWDLEVVGISYDFQYDMNEFSELFNINSNRFSNTIFKKTFQQQLDFHDCEPANPDDIDTDPR